MKRDVLNRKWAKEVLEIISKDEKITNYRIAKILSSDKDISSQIRILRNDMLKSEIVIKQETFKVSNKEMLQRMGYKKSTPKYESILKKDGWEKHKDTSSFPYTVYYTKTER